VKGKGKLKARVVSDVDMEGCLDKLEEADSETGEQMEMAWSG
jgi:hypothetical protein